MNKRKKKRAVAAIVVLAILLAMCSTDIMLRLADSHIHRRVQLR